MKNENINNLKKAKFKSSRIIADKKYRAIVFTSFSLSIGVCYALFNAVMAIVGSSIWCGALAGYYMLLIVLRVSVIIGHGRSVRGSAVGDELRASRTYRLTGIVLLALIAALAVAVAQMVNSKSAFEYAGLMIYAGAAYTFTKVIIAIVNLVKTKKSKDVTLKIIRNINIADAAVSILALQSAMFKAFSEAENNAVANAATGAAVCLFILILGMYMIIKSTKLIRELNNSKTKNQEN